MSPRCHFRLIPTPSSLCSGLSCCCAIVVTFLAPLAHLTISPLPRRRPQVRFSSQRSLFPSSGCCSKLSTSPQSWFVVPLLLCLMFFGVPLNTSHGSRMSSPYSTTRLHPGPKREVLHPARPTEHSWNESCRWCPHFSTFAKWLNRGSFSIRSVCFGRAEPPALLRLLSFVRSFLRLMLNVLCA